MRVFCIFANFSLKFLEGGQLLKIFEVKQNDIGTYSCIVSTTVDKVVSDMAELTIEKVKIIQVRIHFMTY